MSTDHLGIMALGFALAWDLIFGEMPSRFHPVVWMGRLSAFFEKRLYRAEAQSHPSQLWAGGLHVLIMLGAVGVCLYILGQIQPLWLQFALAVFLLQSSFSLKELGLAARRVQTALTSGNLSSARYHMRSLCSRNPASLGEADMVEATCSSLAENIADSVVAPLFYYFLFGLPGAVLFRLVNTLDARIGYRGKYESFGRASARLDDFLGLVPARLTAAMILIAGGISFYPWVSGMRVLRRDRRKTPSPNGGWPMSALAGLLDMKLEKPGVYSLGDAKVSPTPVMISDAWRLVAMSALCFVGLGLTCWILVMMRP